jgi:hypothetical protein
MNYDNDPQGHRAAQWRPPTLGADDLSALSHPGREARRLIALAVGVGIVAVLLIPGKRWKSRRYLRADETG